VSRQTKLFVGLGIGALVIVAVIGAALAFGGSDDSKAAPDGPKASTTLAPTTTTAPPVAPLTGLPDPTGESFKRPALSVKVENYNPDSRPQVGIDQADVVYEEEVEGGITRFVAIFNSTAPDTIGPVRSVRYQDPDIVWPIGGIFAYSGGAAGPVDAINAAPVHAIDNTAAVANGANAMERDAPGQPRRPAPHNLYGHGPALFDLGGDPKPPPPLFQYTKPGSPNAGTNVGDPVASMRIGFTGDYDASYQWDAASSTWKRFQHGEPHLVVSGDQIAPTNVVVQFTQYDGESNGQTVGEGDAWIFTDGRVYKGRWVRPDRAQPARYIDLAGAPITLRPGRTWVELLPMTYPVDIEAPPPPPPTTVPATAAPAPTTTTPKSSK
jgi:Protein of unknown function (DUF3048) N-terminal domain/Protein of unknown function (DUF3048) C-terminal domain